MIIDFTTGAINQYQRGAGRVWNWTSAALGEVGRALNFTVVLDARALTVALNSRALTVALDARALTIESETEGAS